MEKEKSVTVGGVSAGHSVRWTLEEDLGQRLRANGDEWRLVLSLGRAFFSRFKRFIVEYSTLNLYWAN